MGWQEFLQKKVLYCWVFCVANNSFVFWNHMTQIQSCLHSKNSRSTDTTALPKDMLAKQVCVRQNWAAFQPLNFKLNSLYFTKQSLKLRLCLCTYILLIISNYVLSCIFLMCKNKTCISDTHIWIYLMCNHFEFTKGHIFMCY